MGQRTAYIQSTNWEMGFKPYADNMSNNGILQLTVHGFYIRWKMQMR